MDEHVWYCSYGSNLLFDRFRLYIEGGQAGFVDKTYHGCTDKTLPTQSEAHLLRHELYFAHRAAPWEGRGVAFIAHAKDPSVTTHCRIYKVRVDQFKEIVQQENGDTPDASRLEIDFDTLCRTGTLLIGASDQYPLYGKLICSGRKDNLPIVTFTAKADMDEAPLVAPGEKYLATIIRGLQETLPEQGPQIVDYLAPIKGIRNQYTREALTELKNRVGRQYRVMPTGDVMRRGEYFVQINLAHIRPPFKSKYLLLEGDNGLKIQARYENHPKLEKNELCVDQTLRYALGIRVGGHLLVHPMKRAGQPGIFQRFARRLLGIQVNIVRVHQASYNDMEINLCRLRRESLQSINAKSGDHIIVESPRRSIKIRAVEMTEKIAEEIKGRSANDGKKYKDCAKHLGMQASDGSSLDLSPILIDLDARSELDVKECRPVRVYRSLGSEAGKRMHLISVPLILAIIAALISFEFPFLMKVGILIFGVVAIVLLNFIDMKIR